MGRQIGVAMADKDEDEFLRFLKSSSNITIYQQRASSPKLLRIDSFPRINRQEESSTIYLWNNDFKVDPEIEKDSNGGFYLKNISESPVLSYTRHRFSSWFDPLSILDPGRIYWRGKMASGGEFQHGGQSYPYDVVEFERWYNRIVSWVKKNGVERKVKGYYYFPNVKFWHK